MKLTHEQAKDIRLLKADCSDLAWLVKRHVERPNGYISNYSLNGLPLDTFIRSLYTVEGWDIYECECGLGYAIRQMLDDEIEEPACPHCGGTNAKLTQHESVM